MSQWMLVYYIFQEISSWYRIQVEKRKSPTPGPSVPRPVIDPTPEDHAHELIREAEGRKAKMYPTTGESIDQIHSIVKIDQDYQLVGSHIDQQTRDKIIRGEYVDFSKLLPKGQNPLWRKWKAWNWLWKQGKAFLVTSLRWHHNKLL